ncbi:sugar phosphate isomerase/epimerase family protein [Haloferula sp.]|uniref:sugar phosphate isomerase/epimerase family protein n=1 Tax=Haloferula sp. TaxID=2497595 RepID=UPI003C758590
MSRFSFSRIETIAADGIQEVSNRPLTRDRKSLLIANQNFLNSDNLKNLYNSHVYRRNLNCMDKCLPAISYSRRSFGKLTGGALLSLFGAQQAMANPISDELFLSDFGVRANYSDFAMLKKFGYSYIEAGTGDILQPNIPEAKIAEMLEHVREQGIRIHACNGFIPPKLKSTGPNADHEAVLQYADIVFQRAKRFGVKGIVFGSSGSRKIPKEFPREEAEVQFVSLLKKMAPLAAAQEVEIWIEPLNRGEDNFINTQMQGASIIEKVGHPSLGLVCDIYHVAKNEESPEDIKTCIKHIRHCHIAEKARRTPPGVENFDFTPYLRALKESGYRQTMSMECRWKNLEAQAPEALAYLKSQIKSL